VVGERRSQWTGNHGEIKLVVTALLGSLPGLAQTDRRSLQLWSRATSQYYGPEAVLRDPTSETFEETGASSASHDCPTLLWPATRLLKGTGPRADLLARYTLQCFYNGRSRSHNHRSEPPPVRVLDCGRPGRRAEGGRRQTLWQICDGAGRAKVASACLGKLA